MATPKIAAALTSGLLARKGGARPAMRRQPVGLGPRPVSALDDLGWNDMGEEPQFESAFEPTFEAMDLPAIPSPVAAQIANLHATLSETEETEAEPLPAAEIAVPEAVLAPAVQLEAAPVNVAPLPTRRTAFTLRIDAERHLRLRLLSAVTNRSAQQLMIAALDALIAAHPNVDALATDPNARQRSKPTDPELTNGD